jgi:hypothetical protein
VGAAHEVEAQRPIAVGDHVAVTRAGAQIEAALGRGVEVKP